MKLSKIHQTIIFCSFMILTGTIITRILWYEGRYAVYSFFVFAIGFYLYPLVEILDKVCKITTKEDTE